jgi:hypothetical protein
VSKQRSKREVNSPAHPADLSPDQKAEARARKKVRTLWQAGDLFHMCTRYPRKTKAPRIDRLAGILRTGLVAPGRCKDGSVLSDLNLVVTGCGVPYDSLVFLHRFGSTRHPPRAWVALQLFPPPVGSVGQNSLPQWLRPHTNRNENDLSSCALR